MEGCGVFLMECLPLGKAICTINTIMRFPGFEHVSLLLTFVSIFSSGTDCDKNALFKKNSCFKTSPLINNEAYPLQNEHEHNHQRLFRARRHYNSCIFFFLQVIHQLLLQEQSPRDT